jgi:hypothetical protein
MYQNVPSQFTSEGKDVQTCMNRVQACFDSNAGTQAQDACASHVATCFDFGNEGLVNASVGLLGAGAAASMRGLRARASAANFLCTTRPSSGAASALIPYGKDWSVLLGGSNGRVAANAHPDLVTSMLACSLPRLAGMPPSPVRRPAASLDADRLGMNLPSRGITRLAALNSDAWCPPKTSPAAARIPEGKLPSDGTVPPKVTNSGRSSSGINLAAPGRDTPKVKPAGGSSSGSNTVRTGGTPVSPSGASAMDRLSGGSTFQGGGGSSGPAGRRAPAGASGGGGSSSGINTSRPTGGGSSSQGSSSGAYMSRQP